MGLLSRHKTIWKLGGQTTKDFFISNKVMSVAVASQWYGLTPDNKPIDWGTPDQSLVEEAKEWKEDSRNGVNDIRKQYILEKLTKAGITQGKWLFNIPNSKLVPLVDRLTSSLESGKLGIALEFTCTAERPKGGSIILVGISTPDFNNRGEAYEVLKEARKIGLLGTATYKPVGVTLLEDDVGYKMKIFPLRDKRKVPNPKTNRMKGREKRPATPPADKVTEDPVKASAA
eukprot:TRINITY_DN114_c1_g1_i1.p1 TRINITY_DN114_c1_g1~~TRINITY_DN114_c1_g1_i1.p1  ORF type:complete len:230 (+),score=27.50 TRINITY_DN114_c1_g1_i1:77-766(+)